MKVEELKTRKILNSAGNLSLEVEIHSKNKEAYASVPSGKSTGKSEVTIYPRGSIDKGVKQLRDHIKKIKGREYQEFEDVLAIEEELPPTGTIGGNTVLAVEYALLRLLAKSKGVPIYYLINKTPSDLPKPIANVIGGGSHAFQTGPSFQEFLMISKYESVKENVFMNAKIYNKLTELFDIYGRDYENAFCVDLKSQEVLERFKEVKSENREIGLDIAASGFSSGQKYKVDGKSMYWEDYLSFLKQLIEKFDVFYIEDPFEEGAFQKFRKLKEEFPDKLICGDDLTTTNPTLIQKAIREEAINSVIIKPNQIGSLKKTAKAIRMAFKNRLVPIISHRSEETNDPIITHLAVGFQVPYIKTGVAGGERIAKLNELIRIEEKLG